MDIFDALAEPTRREILEVIAKKENTQANDIYSHFTISPQAVSQHLKVLKEASLILMQKDAQRRLYSLNPNKILEIENWAKVMRQTWNKRFDVLDKLIEDEKKKLC